MMQTTPEARRTLTPWTTALLVALLAFGVGSFLVADGLLPQSAATASGNEGSKVGSVELTVVAVDQNGNALSSPISPIISVDGNLEGHAPANITLGPGTHQVLCGTVTGYSAQTNSSQVVVASGSQKTSTLV